MVVVGVDVVVRVGGGVVVVGVDVVVRVGSNGLYMRVHAIQTVVL